MFEATARSGLPACLFGTGLFLFPKRVPGRSVWSKNRSTISIDNFSDGRPIHDPMEASLTTADDRVRLSHWMPRQSGIVPVIRLRTKWYSVLWALPIVFVLLVIGVAVAQALRLNPDVQAFLIRYPGAPPTARVVTSCFPVWLRVGHFLNLFFMMFIIRAGVQILADHPRLYCRRDCTPGTDLFRFQKPVPTDRVWTSKDDSVTIPGWLGIPGIRHSIGLSRWWHFTFNALWVLNGIALYVLLFATDQWCGSCRRRGRCSRMPFRPSCNICH